MIRLCRSGSGSPEIVTKMGGKRKERRGMDVEKEGEGGKGNKY
jgi:hypothetical protein